ncbi:hypothetical protein IGI04_013813, partial [Brassica rapa subsp. trilocularis]
QVLAAPEKLKTKEEPKAYEEDWKKAGTEENVDMERGNEAEGKVSKILADGYALFARRETRGYGLQPIRSKRKAVPGKELQKKDAPGNSIINAVSSSQKQRRRNKTRSMADSGDSTAKLSQIAFQIKGGRRWKLESFYGIIEEKETMGRLGPKVEIVSYWAKSFEAQQDILHKQKETLR